MSKLKHSILILAAAVSLILMPIAANAAYTQLYCTANGTVGTDLQGNPSQLFFADEGAAGSNCQYTNVDPILGQQVYIFGKVLCNFVSILNTVLGKIYCGIQYAIQGPLAALLSLYIAVFAVQILMGTAQMNAKEIITRLLKIGAVFTFVTQSAWGIGLAFRFFLSVMNEGSMWVIRTIAIQNNLPFQNATTVMPIFGFIDNLVYQTLSGPFAAANEKVIGFFLILLGTYPPLFIMAFYWAIETFMLMMRMLLSLLMALSSIAFLISLSPFFLSFMLFKITFHFFENWLRYMVSYALQVVVVFAILTLWICAMGLFAPFFNQLSNLIFPYQQATTTTTVTTPMNTWGICEGYTVTSGGTTGPSTACPAGFPRNPPNTQLIPVTNLFQNPRFLYYLIYHLMSLILVAFVFSKILKNAPNLARDLLAGSRIPPVGSGFGMQG